MGTIGADIVLKTLAEEGVEVIFGYPGANTLPLNDRLADSPIRHYLMRHEQAAAHAADGYARATGKVGVCLATSGPGATNLVTGIATAYMDSTPFVAITAQIDIDPTSIGKNIKVDLPSRIAGVFSSRGYNIRSLCVAETTNPEVSRITLTSRAESDFTEKIKKQLDKLVDVIAVTDFTGAPSVQRELMLISLCLKEENRQEILRAIDIFGCRVVAMSEDCLIMEITANKDKTAAILRYFEPFGVEEMNRTGAIAVFRQKREG